MKNPHYKKLSKAEKEAETLHRELMPEKVQNAIHGYFRVFCIVVGIIFLIKGLVGIVWRTIH